MFDKTARYYDLIYQSRRGPEADIEAVVELVERFKLSSGSSLLDVACGTGIHIPLFQRHFGPVEGLDLDAGLLNVARERCPDVPLHHMDMVDFSLERSFDIVTCLFSSIGYAGTVERLNQAIATMASHLEPGGVLIVEPWLMPDVWEDGHLDFLAVDEPEIKIARMTDGRRDGPLTTLNMHYLISTREGTEYLVEEHRVMMFTHDEYLSAFRTAGLAVHHDPDIMPLGRGVYVGVRPSE